MGFFNWAAPAFGKLADRWSHESLESIAGRLRPALTGRRRVLDVGGGTGALAGRLADALDARVTVLDPTPEMVRYAPDRDDVEVVIGVAEEMPFDDDAFDALIVTDAFHHFRDLDAAAAEIARVVRTGGVVQVVELDPSRAAIKLIAFGERLLREPAHFLGPTELETLMARHGVEGTCEDCQGVEYVFVGTVRRDPSEGGPPAPGTG
jgi:demethylmenaquinone methyltransferase/2-methoxy-6-polyprenyl-1,4-benzoquinol methylase